MICYRVLFFCLFAYSVTPQVALFSAPIFAADTVDDHLRALNGSPPIYKPPKENAPHSRIEGGTRGGKNNEPGVMALVPDHVGFTIKKDPTLYWYLSKPTSLPVRFTLVDAQSVRPTFEAMLSHPHEAGIQKIRLKDYEVALIPGVQYRWFVSLVVNGEKPSEDIVTGGMIERVDFNEGSALGLPLVCDKPAVSRYAEAGLWYDAISCISELVESNPDDVLLRKHRAYLLKQIDLLDIDHENRPNHNH